jgi:hypothetical protein
MTELLRGKVQRRSRVSQKARHHANRPVNNPAPGPSQVVTGFGKLGCSGPANSFFGTITRRRKMQTMVPSCL